MSNAHDASRASDRVAEKIVVGSLIQTRVQPATDAKSDPFCFFRIRERLL